MILILFYEFVMFNRDIAEEYSFVIKLILEFTLTLL